MIMNWEECGKGIYGLVEDVNPIQWFPCEKGPKGPDSVRHLKQDKVIEGIFVRNWIHSIHTDYVSSPLQDINTQNHNVLFQICFSNYIEL